MLKMQLIDLAQNPKVAGVIGGVTASTGIAVNWFELVKEWMGAGSIAIGVALSLAALIAQVVRIRNDRAADRRAEAAERRAEEMHRAQIEAMTNARKN